MAYFENGIKKVKRMRNSKVTFQFQKHTTMFMHSYYQKQHKIAASHPASEPLNAVNKMKPDATDIAANILQCCLLSYYLNFHTMSKKELQ